MKFDRLYTLLTEGSGKGVKRISKQAREATKEFMDLYKWVLKHVNRIRKKTKSNRFHWNLTPIGDVKVSAMFKMTDGDLHMTGRHYPDVNTIEIEFLLPKSKDKREEVPLSAIWRTVFTSFVHEMTHANDEITPETGRKWGRGSVSEYAKYLDRPEEIKAFAEDAYHQARMRYKKDKRRGRKKFFTADHFIRSNATWYIKHLLKNHYPDVDEKYYDEIANKTSERFVSAASDYLEKKYNTDGNNKFLRKQETQNE
jgi:hypothetical protein